MNDVEKDLSLYTYEKPHVNLTWHTAYSYADYDDKLDGLYFTHIGFNIKEKNNHVLVRANEKINSFDVSDLYFKGLYNDLSNPIGILNDKLSNSSLTFDENFSASMQFKVELKPNEEKEINIVSCYGENEGKIKEVSDKYISNESYYNELNYQKELHSKLNEKFIMNSNDEYIEREYVCISISETDKKPDIAVKKREEWHRLFEDFIESADDEDVIVSVDIHM